MPSTPPRAMEVCLGLLLPSACREPVLGDLRERCTGSRQYFAEALHTLPLVIISRIRRTTDTVVLFMEAGILYSVFLAAAWFLNPAFLNDERALPRLAIPPAIMLVALMLIDAYADPRKRSPLRPILGAVLAVALALLSQALPQRIMIAGASASLLLIATLRLLFPPVTDRPQGVNVPAFWQKQTVDPIGARALWVVPIAVCLLFVYQLLKRG